MVNLIFLQSFLWVIVSNFGAWPAVQDRPPCYTNSPLIFAMMWDGEFEDDGSCRNPVKYVNEYSKFQFVGDEGAVQNITSGLCSDEYLKMSDIYFYTNDTLTTHETWTQKLSFRVGANEYAREGYTDIYGSFVVDAVFEVVPSQDNIVGSTWVSFDNFDNDLLYNDLGMPSCLIEDIGFASCSQPVSETNTVSGLFQSGAGGTQDTCIYAKFSPATPTSVEYSQAAVNTNLWRPVITVVALLVLVLTIFSTIKRR